MTRVYPDTRLKDGEVDALYGGVSGREFGGLGWDFIFNFIYEAEQQLVQFFWKPYHQQKMLLGSGYSVGEVLVANPTDSTGTYTLVSITAVTYDPSTTPIVGVLSESGSSGSKARVITGGTGIPPSIHGLSAGASGGIVADPTTGQLARAGTTSAPNSEVLVGTINTRGYVTLRDFSAYLPATAGGRAQMASDYFTYAAVVDKFDVGMVMDLGCQGVGYIRFTGTTSNAELVTVVGTVTENYEFRTSGSVSVAGYHLADVSGGNSASQSATALANSINSNSSEIVAYATGAVCYFVSKTATSSTGTYFVNQGVTTTCAHAALSSSALTDGSKTTFRYQARSEHSVAAEEVTALAAGKSIAIGAFASSTAPQISSFSIRSIGGVYRSTATVQLVWTAIDSGTKQLLLLTDGSAVLQTNDIVSWVSSLA